MAWDAINFHSLLTQVQSKKKSEQKMKNTSHTRKNGKQSPLWKGLKMFEACNDQILKFTGHGGGTHMGRTQFLKPVDVLKTTVHIEAEYIH